MIVNKNAVALIALPSVSKLIVKSTKPNAFLKLIVKLINGIVISALVIDKITNVNDIPVNTMKTSIFCGLNGLKAINKTIKQVPVAHSTEIVLI